MNKKLTLVLSILLIGALAFGAGMGSFAFFSKTVSSTNNSITADTFNLTATGLTNATGDFAVAGFAPGMNGEHPFTIVKGTSALGVAEYTVVLKLLNSGVEGSTSLFRNAAKANPFIFKLMYSTDGTNYTQAGIFDPVAAASDAGASLAIAPVTTADNGTDYFKLAFEWPYGTDSSDSALLGAAGLVNFDVLAKQENPANYVGNPANKTVESYVDYFFQNDSPVSGSALVTFDNAMVKPMSINNVPGINQGVTISAYNSTNTRATLNFAGSNDKDGEYNVSGIGTGTVRFYRDDPDFDGDWIDEITVRILN